MSVTPQVQAILLLTVHLSVHSSKASNKGAKPLTPGEWNKFSSWLHENKQKPEALMTGSLHDTLRGWADQKVTLDRISALLDRGSALALAMEKWLRAGLWVMTRSEADYPAYIKQKLGKNSPPVFFGCGNPRLLNKGGLAVVGSRKTSDADLNYSSQIGVLAAENGRSIISGGARGVDEAAMQAALSAEGNVVGVLDHGLLKATSNVKYREHLMTGNLVLVTPFHPEAGFHVGHAMQRNKYIYCLSDAALVVHSGIKGGTWSGAQENLKKQWVPLWVKETEDKTAGNKNIVASGGRWVTSGIDDLDIASFFKDHEAQIDSYDSVAELKTLTPASATSKAPEQEQIPFPFRSPERH